MNNPKISIVLPCYNGAKMLGSAIDSILAQTFQDWELIIVNDCSTDNTLEVAQLYADKDARVRVVSNEKNSKLPATLNHGFREARGEYWTWTSDDNLLLPNYCQEMNDYLDSHPEVGFVVSDEQHIDEAGNIMYANRMPNNLSLILPINNYIGASFKYRAEIARKIGEYRVDLFLVEDYEYFLRLNDVCGVGVISKELYQYRIHPGSLSATRQRDVQERHTRIRIEYLPKAEKRFENHPKLRAQYYNMIVDRLSGRERWKYYWEFFKKMPIHFGLRYWMIHVPHRTFKNLKHQS